MKRGVTQPMHSLRHDVDALERAFAAVIPGVQPGPSPAYLLVRTESGEVERVVLDRPVMLIGRSGLADIRRDDPQVSLQHAKLVAQGSHHWLHDLGRDGGVEINGERVREAQLREGDTFQIGDSHFTYRAAFRPLERVMHSESLMVPVAGPDPSLAVREMSHGAIHAPVDGDDRVDLQELVGKVRRVLAFFRYYWKSVAASTVFGLTLALAHWVHNPPPAEALFSINLVAEATQNPIDRARIEFFQAPKETFRAATLVEASLEKLRGRAAEPEEVAETVESLTLKRAGRYLWEGSFTSYEGPETALRFLEIHLQEYVGEEIDKTLSVLNTQVATMRTELEETRRQLRRIEADRKRFKREHSGRLPQHGDHFGSLAELRQRRFDLGSSLKRVNLELEHARRKLRSDDAILGERVDAVRPLESTKLGLKQQLAEARANKLGDDHPDVVGLRAQLKELDAEIEKVIRHEPTKIERRLNPEFRSMQSTVDRLQVEQRVANAQLGSVNSEIGRVEGVVEGLPELETEAAEFERSYDVKQAYYDRVYHKYRTTEMQLQLERDAAQGRYQLVTEPYAAPVSRTRQAGVRGLMGAVAGFLLGIFLGIVRQVGHYVVLRA